MMMMVLRFLVLAEASSGKIGSQLFYSYLYLGCHAQRRRYCLEIVVICDSSLECNNLRLDLKLPAYHYFGDLLDFPYHLFQVKLVPRALVGGLNPSSSSMQHTHRVRGC